MKSHPRKGIFCDIPPLEIGVTGSSHPPLTHPPCRSLLYYIVKRTLFICFSPCARKVLGKTLSRLACYQVAEAWRAELQAREHETRLLEELEVRVWEEEECVWLARVSSGSKRNLILS